MMNPGTHEPLCRCRQAPLHGATANYDPASWPSARCCISIASNTVLPTPEGWITLESVEPGQQVFDELGRKCSAKWTHNGMQKLTYKVRFDDESSIQVSASHPWMTLTHGARAQIRQNKNLFSQWSSGIFPYTTQELRDSLTCRSGDQDCAMHSIPLAHALQMPERELAIHPYVLGLWLGDGSSDAAIITCSRDDEPHYRERMRGIGENWKISRRSGNVLHCTLAGEPVPRLRTRLGQLGVLRGVVK